jgi:hypothetical protein
MKDIYKPYLKEWLDHHRSIGVDWFFIYDNDSAVSLMSMDNNVIINKISGKAMQIPAYEKCLSDMKTGKLPACDRLAFIDEDEFIVCENGDIKKTLEDYAEFPALGITWRMFGSSGLKDKTPEPQRKKFTQHTTGHPYERHIKSIVDPLRTTGSSGNPHAFFYIAGACVNVEKIPVDGTFTTPIYRKIWIDHYYTRSLEEWKEKMVRGRADTATEGRRFELIDEIDANCSRKTKQIHLITPFMRHHLKAILIAAYGPINVLWHPIVFQDESADFNEPWIFPYVIPMNRADCKSKMPQYTMRNHWIQNNEIIDDDYYVTVDDDDMYEADVFDAIKEMNDDIVIISMKRGYQIPKDAAPIRQYPIETLWAHADYVQRGKISSQQSFVKGKIFKKHLFDDSSQFGDGDMAIHHKEAGEQIAYRSDLFALFNFYEPGRWEREKSPIAFGVLINDLVRFDMVLRQSEIQGDMKFVKNPESATKGLNKLLKMIEAEGAEIAVLCHQDMYFRQGWVSLVREQIAKLPESWVVAGVIGKDYQGRICGKFHDMRMPQHFNTEDIHTFPHPACCMDEAVIIVNLKKGFRFDEAMDGFDLYGTLCVLQTWEMGGSAFIIDAFCEHYCMRPFTWFPDEKFCKNYKWLYEKFNEIYRLDSTALGLSEEKKVFKTSAAPFEEKGDEGGVGSENGKK